VFRQRVRCVWKEKLVRSRMDEFGFVSKNVNYDMVLERRKDKSLE
jgi:hypothetical protein